MRIGLVLTLFLMLSVPFVSNAQNRMEKMMHKRMGRLLRLEQMKLIDLLDLDETTAVKLFARRKENLEKQHKLMDVKSDYLTALRKAIRKKDSTACDSLVSKVLNVEKEITDNRAKFIRSLSDILSKEQIAKLVLFEANLKKELKRYLMHRRMHQ